MCTVDIRLCVFVGARVGGIFLSLLLSFTLILHLKKCKCSILICACHVPYKEYKVCIQCSCFVYP